MGTAGAHGPAVVRPSAAHARLLREMGRRPGRVRPGRQIGQTELATMLMANTAFLQLLWSVAAFVMVIVELAA